MINLKSKNQYANLVGYILPHLLGATKIYSEVKRNHWDDVFLTNKAISKVYIGLFNDSKSVTIPSMKVTNEFNKFKKEFFNRFTPNTTTEMGGSFDEIVDYGYEIDTPGAPTIRFNATEQLVDCNFGDYELAFVPYNDGVMLVHIDVEESERNKGTGTFVMNRLYDISEDINVPIYLIPYPAGHFNSKTEKDVVTILKNWYEKLGFGPVSEGSKVWCNFE